MPDAKIRKTSMLWLPQQISGEKNAVQPGKKETATLGGSPQKTSSRFVQALWSMVSPVVA